MTERTILNIGDWMDEKVAAWATKLEAVNPDLQPPGLDQETYQLLLLELDITKARRLAARHPEPDGALDVADYYRRMIRNGIHGADPERAAKAFINPDIPVLMARLFHSAPGADTVIIDGAHRILRAYMEGRETVQVILLEPWEVEYCARDRAFYRKARQNTMNQLFKNLDKEANP